MECPANRMDYRGLLITLSRRRGIAEPVYSTTAQGPEHMPTWRVQLDWNGYVFTAFAPTARKAMQEASEQAYRMHERDGPDNIVVISDMREVDIAGRISTTIIFVGAFSDLPPVAEGDLATVQRLCAANKKRIWSHWCVHQTDDAKKVLAISAIAAAFANAIVAGTIVPHIIVIKMSTAAFEQVIVDALRPLYPGKVAIAAGSYTA